MIDTTLIDEVTKLPASERLEFMGAIWQSLEPTDQPITEAEKQLIDQRLAELEAAPHDQSTWHEVKQRLAKKLP